MPEPVWKEVHGGGVGKETRPGSKMDSDDQQDSMYTYTPAQHAMRGGVIAGAGKTVKVSVEQEDLLLEPEHARKHIAGAFLGPKQRLEESGGPWCCPSCSCINPASYRHCRVCGTDNPNPPLLSTHVEELLLDQIGRAHV